MADHKASLASKAKLNTRRASLSLGVSVLGVGRTAATGDIGSAVFALMAAVAGLPRNDSKNDVTSFLYIIQTQRQFGSD